MVAIGGNEDLRATAEAEKRYCQSELEKLADRKSQALADLGAVVAEREKNNQSFWNDYPQQAAALADVDQLTKTFEERIAKAEGVIKQDENRQRGERIQNSPWSKVCACGASCPELAKFCPSCGAKFLVIDNPLNDSPDSNGVPPLVETRRCPKCGKIYSSEFGFCESCGSILEVCAVNNPLNEMEIVDQCEELSSLQQDLRQETVIDENIVCPQCGAFNKAHAKFCGNCRTQLK